MTPHYPTTAELAAFRRTIARQSEIGVDAMHPVHASRPAPGAWDHETRDGIGYRVLPLPGPAWKLDPHASRATIARREASAIRTRAYARKRSWGTLRALQTFAPVTLP